jgi:CubicO group peptidase (beta-lactamase class C family)
MLQKGFNDRRFLFFLSLFLIMIFFLNSCHFVRFFVWNVADLRDYKKFPSHSIAHDPQNIFYFSEAEDKDSREMQWEYRGKKSDLTAFLQKHKSVAFLIIQNDRVLYERYFRGYSRQSVIPVFSVAKSFVSALIGIAVEDGKIDSIDDPITLYINEFRHAGFENIRIRDLLDMKSGIRYNEGYLNPFGDVARFYYGRNLKKYCDRLKIRTEAGLEYDYVSANTQLLAQILETATGKKISAYLEEKIWKETGMEHVASWSIDCKKHQNIKSFCCLNTNARDLARFGRLYLNKGSFEDRQIIPEQWIMNTLMFREKTKGKEYEYRYHWRAMPSGAIFAQGLMGQYLYVHPAKDLIIVRLGKSYHNIDWIDVFEEISRTL